MRFLVSTCVVLLLVSALAAGAADKRRDCIKIRTTSQQQRIDLSHQFDVDLFDGSFVYARVDSEDLLQLESLGYEWVPVVTEPLRGTITMATTVAGMANWDAYPTWAVYNQMMQAYATQYPTLCKLDTIGYSVQGRALLFMKISKNVNVEEDEPEILYTSTMHGCEGAGYVLMLRLIDSLLTGYACNQADIVELIDNCEIWINPLANPDGTYHDGENTITPYPDGYNNANDVNLNRNYPDRVAGDHPDNNAYQAETIAMMQFAEQHSIVLSANFHTGLEMFNYPWDNPDFSFHPDDDWFVSVGLEYRNLAWANSFEGYMTLGVGGVHYDEYVENPGVLRGWVYWYIRGGRQDYMTHFRGDREATIELHNSPHLADSDTLPFLWQYNRASLLAYLANGLTGIRGVVTDNCSGEPIDARIEVVGHDVAADNSYVFTDPDVGDYHRLIEAGTYTIKVTSTGYPAVFVNNVSVTAGQDVRADVTMQWLRGDANGDGSVSMADCQFLISYVFSGGPYPPIMAAADANCDGSVNVGDAVFLAQYLYNNGPAPCQECVCGSCL